MTTKISPAMSLVSGDPSTTYLAHYLPAAASDSEAFQAAVDALPVTGGTIVVAENRDYTVAGLSVGSKKIVWRGTGKVNGNYIWGLAGIQDTYHPELGRQIYSKADGAALDGTYKDNRRAASYSGGATGQLDYIERWETTIAASVGASGGSGRKGEKAGLFRVNNQSANANGIALFLAAFAESTGATWALECSTHSEASPTNYAHRSAEFNIHGYGADPNNLRWVVNTASHNEDQVYSGTPGTDVVGVLHEVYPDTADTNYAIRVRELPGAGATRGEVLEAGVRIEVSSDLIQAIHPSASGFMRLGSKKATAGIVSQIIAQGNNSAGEATGYVDLRSEIQTATDGAEDGLHRILAMKAGTLTEMFRINGSLTSPVSLYVSGTLKQVTEGAADSAGAGYRALRVPN